MSSKDDENANASRYMGGIHYRPEQPLFPSRWAEEAGQRAHDTVVRLSASTKSGIDLRLPGAADLQSSLETIAARYEVDREWRNRRGWSEYDKSIKNFKAAANNLSKAWRELRGPAQIQIVRYMPDRGSASPQSRRDELEADIEALSRAVERAHEGTSYRRDQMSKDEQSRAGKNPDIHLHTAVKSLVSLWPTISPTLLMQFQEFHFLLMPSGAYRLIIFMNQQACGFLDPINVNPQTAAVMFDAANQMNAEPQSPVTQPYPGSPELEALYYLTREASPRSENYPSDTCVPLEPTEGRAPREAMDDGSFRGEPVLYLSHRSMQNPASDMLFHIMGPNKYKNFTWVEGIMLRARGEQTDIILVANYNACGFDGRVSFPTAQVKRWLETRPNNRVTFEAGDPIPMTPQERQQLRKFLETR